MNKQSEILKKININNSYLITGISGCGKTTLGYEIIRNMISKVNPSKVHTFPDNYPDFYYLEGGKVDDIRNLLVEINKKPFYNKHFVMIDKIDELSLEGQNLLLKPLEESNVFFVLISNDDSKVINTIFSRTYKVSPVLLNKNEIKEILINDAKGEYNEDFLNKIIELSSNSLGKAKLYMSEPILKEFIEDLINIKDRNFFILASKYKEFKEYKNEFIYLVEVFIRNNMISSSKKAKYFALTVKINQYKKHIINNANLSMIYENIFSELIKLAN